MIYNFVDYPFKFIWQDFEIIQHYLIAIFP